MKAKRVKPKKQKRGYNVLALSPYDIIELKEARGFILGMVCMDYAVRNRSCHSN